MRKLTAVILIVFLLISICSAGVWACDEIVPTETESEDSLTENAILQATDVADVEQGAESCEVEDYDLLHENGVDIISSSNKDNTGDDKDSMNDGMLTDMVDADEPFADEADVSGEAVLENAGEEVTTLDEDEAPSILFVTYINPLYADVITEDDLVKPGEAVSVPSVAIITSDYATSLSEAAVQMREGLVSRETTITVQYTSTGFTQELVDEEGSSIYSLALEHTGVSTEGDYLRWQLGGWTATYTRDKVSGDVYYISAVYT
ncbi:MAG: hypothetical protein LUH36_03785, partial [Oscillospiraceae bacterium]|nr:hypothetical protein [Oscillospiraceae bacterium]